MGEQHPSRCAICRPSPHTETEGTGPGRPVSVSIESDGLPGKENRELRTLVGHGNYGKVGITRNRKVPAILARYGVVPPAGVMRLV